MNSRGKTSSQHQSGMGAQPGNFIATGQQAYPIGASGPLVDVSNYGGASGRQSNAVPQNRFNGQNNSSMNEFLTMQESRVNGFLQHSAQQIDMQRSALQQVANHLSSTATNIGQSIAQWMGHPASERAAALYQELEKSRGRQIDADNQYRQLKDEYQALEKRLQDSNTELENAIRERDKQRLLAESANWTGSTKVSDDAIQSKWKQLGYNIRAMSRSLAKCQIHRPQNDETKNRLSMAVPRSKKLLLNDDHKEFVISAYLWAIVAEIIEEGSEIMGGDHGMNFKAIRAEFIGAAPEGDKPSGRGPTLRHVARWEMKAIIDTALELDEMLMNSKAIFTIRRPESDGSKNQRFDATEMEAFIQGQEMKAIIDTALELDEMLMNSKAIFTIRRPESDGRC
ncbi:unnamed protein product [Fusarium fujikuroi]|nr:unnamed protein product [Fusarium fujikuroi]